MKNLCKHCATAFKPTPELDAFCCRGCERVYTLIHEGGLDGYYRLQDRVAEPLKNRSLPALDRAGFARVQSEAESSSAAPECTLSVDGMSCMGCAWLIERLARNGPGTLAVRVDLVNNAVNLRWEKGQFDLAAFASVLNDFGYALGSRPIDLGAGPTLSPYAVRVLLVGIFCGNALLLAAYAHFIGSSGTDALIHLLSAACIVFASLIGIGPYVFSIYRSAHIRRFHSDVLPAGVLLVCAAVLVAGVFIGMLSFSSAGAVFVSAVFLLIVARWISALVA